MTTAIQNSICLHRDSQAPWEGKDLLFSGAVRSQGNVLLGEWEFRGFLQLPLPVSIYLTEFKAVWAGNNVKREKEAKKITLSVLFWINKAQACCGRELNPSHKWSSLARKI